LANPENYITKDCPPFFIQHGLADTVVPFQQSILFADKLERMIGPDKVTLELFSQVDHAEEFFRTPENTDKIYAFFDQYLKS
ncbi:S9 family peptidase, partial [Parabacteroides distasonis]